MHRRFRQSLLLILAVPGFAACASVGRSGQHANGRDLPPARRLVLALDGIDYRDVVDARAHGLFAQFRPPSRLISTFPSISDIAWHDIFVVQPPKGYQRIYYSTAFNSVIGGPLDAIRPIEFEDRMDMAFGAKFHHLGAYIASNRVARREVDVAVRDFFDYVGQSTVYVYNVGPDALQHTRGDLAGYLRHLDRRLSELQARYRERTGEPLEIVVLSDHGHNRGVDAAFLPVVEELEAHGFRASTSLRSDNDVAFSVDGVTTGFGVFVRPPSVERLALALSGIPGIDVVTRRVSDSLVVVLRDAESAHIEARVGATGERYRYVADAGDPLQYRPVLAAMRAAGALDDEGFADAADWLRHTADARYPAGVVRIMRGHSVVTLNPAPILVSLEDGYRVGLGMVSVANKLRPLGGTHGALSATNSQGVLMTTFADTHDDLTSSVNAQLGGFSDLGARQHGQAGARLTTWTLTLRDRRSPFQAAARETAEPPAPGALEVWLTRRDREWLGRKGALFVELREVRHAGIGDSVVGSSYLALPESLPSSSVGSLPSHASTASSGGASDAMPVGGAMEGGAAPTGDQGWLMTEDQLRYLLPLSALHPAGLRASAEYEVRVTIDRVVQGPRASVAASRVVARLAVHTTERGDLWPF